MVKYTQKIRRLLPLKEFKDFTMSERSWAPFSITQQIWNTST